MSGAPHRSDRQSRQTRRGGTRARNRRGWRAPLLVAGPGEMAPRRSLAKNLSPRLLIWCGTASCCSSSAGTGPSSRCCTNFCDEFRPILGINLGTLGFLTCVSAAAWPEAIEAVASGTYRLKRTHFARCGSDAPRACATAGIWRSTMPSSAAVSFRS